MTKQTQRHIFAVGPEDRLSFDRENVVCSYLDHLAVYSFINPSVTTDAAVAENRVKGQAFYKEKPVN